MGDTRVGGGVKNLSRWELKQIFFRVGGGKGGKGGTKGRASLGGDFFLESGERGGGGTRDSSSFGKASTALLSKLGGSENMFGPSWTNIVFNIYIIYLFININIYVENMRSGATSLPCLPPLYPSQISF